MERPNRPKSQDKWRRIIQPAGDSDSSDWSSTDSDIGGIFTDYRCCKTMAGHSSSGSVSDRPPTPVTVSGEDVPQNNEANDSASLVHPKSEGTSSHVTFFRLRSQNTGTEDKDIKPDVGSSTSSMLQHSLPERNGSEDLASSTDRFWQLARNRLSSLRDGAFYAGANLDLPAMPSSSSAGSEGLDCWNEYEYLLQTRTPPPPPPPPPPFRKRFIVGFTGDNNGNPFFIGPKNIQDNMPSTSSDVHEQFSPSKWLVPKSYKRSCLTNAGSVSQSNDDSSDIQIVSVLGGAPSLSTAVRSSSCSGAPPVKKVRWCLPEDQDDPPQCMFERPAAARRDESSKVEVINLEESVGESCSGSKTTDAAPAVSESCETQQPGPSFVSAAATVVRKSEEDEQLNQGIIGLLECPVCMEYMGLPIHQCRRGHLICANCKPKLQTCPTCRSRFSEQRNLAMEKVAEKLHYPCKNVIMGCMHTLRLGEREEHESNCEHRNYRCAIVPPCPWRGQQHEILTHIRMTHSESLLFGAQHELKMLLGDFSEQRSQNWVVSAFGELFRVNLGAVRGGRIQVFGCVVYMGPAYRAAHFKYSLTVGGDDGPDMRTTVFSRTTHRYAEKCADYYSGGDSFHLRTEAAQLYSVGPCNMLLVQIKIEKVNKKK